ncbi:Oidioi.mRNA.OKI2018_I69.chr2.g5532.t1.cds [Oikopleura dioica]|uniref:Oidioi.mRNA.OKI2018_I69.chr2.g5532.t1.cds n=1 Tax=Oikopleura dioica TaxID=34765 RepID=A0ABN7T9S1_OIKDI|nr:Oidioi.mRNA.OKI2018_I69.chr2.g5532.t1.cds [Oikopleura dioica]
MLEPSDRVNELYENASKSVEQTFEISAPIIRYFRTMETMNKYQKLFVDQRRFVEAYVLQIKIGVLFLKHVKQHPEFLTFKASNSSIVSNGRNQAKEALNLAEVTKSKLLDIFAKEKVAFDETQKRLAAEAEMERAKQEMWVLENERRALEQESSTIDTEGFIPKETSTPVDAADHNLPPPPYQAEQGHPQVPDRSTKPRSSSTSTASSSVNSIVPGLKIIAPSANARSIHQKVTVPALLGPEFLKYAFVNSSQNIETIGMLFAKSLQGRFQITTCLLPKQKGTHDSCTTTNEEQIWEFQSQHPELIMLGWIHTHPDYQAFLSSVDMHNQYLYQSLLPEALALVVSPNYKEIGAFRLTETGLTVIGNCKEKGFHPHNKNPPLFEAAPNVEYLNSPIEMVDLRS